MTLVTPPVAANSVPASRTAQIRALAKTDAAGASALLVELLADLFAFEARNLAINFDQYSLNSLNGFFETDAGAFFFKFHQEEGEEAMAGEYYRADILARAGLPVDQPVRMSVLPGEQILIYKRRADPRLSDVLRALDLDDDAEQRAIAVAAERDLSTKISAVYRQTLHPVTTEQVAHEPIHRLFYERLVGGPDKSFPGGRYADFYIGKPFAFVGENLDWEQFRALKFRINGLTYARSIGELFDAAHERLHPKNLAGHGGVTAHGDAHNANVWFTRHNDHATLAFFDPAFAGEHVPALLAEVKATFHNVFAHPLWLYDPALASERYCASARLEGDILHVTTDWRLSPVRQELLLTKAEGIWRPLLSDLKARELLPEDWRSLVRLALFLCPTLVMNLRAGATTHTPISSLLAFSVAVMVGSEPVGGQDAVTEFLDRITPDAD